MLPGYGRQRVNTYFNGIYYLNLNFDRNLKPIGTNFTRYCVYLEMGKSKIPVHQACNIPNRRTAGGR